ncbi:MAG TPA: S8 family serine peptidase [Caldilinea sp.]|nr:S8 family serine peptidase [Caldilinea sp.]
MRKHLAGLVLLCVLCWLPAPAFAQETPPSDGTIYLQTGAFDPLAAGAVTAAADAGAHASPYYLVQFTGPVQPLWLEQVAALGGEVVGYVPNDTHIVRMAPGTVAAVQSLPGVRWVGPFRPAYKVAPALVEAATAVNASAAAPVDLSVLAFPGESVQTLTAFLAAQGATIVETGDSPIGPIVRAQAPLAVLPALAQQPAVSWVEPYIQPSTTNAEGRKVMGAEAVWQSFGYYGAGQIVAISDSGLSVQGALSADFAGRLIRAFAPSEMNLSSAQCKAKTTYTDLNGHGTHVAGSVLGSGARSGSNAATHSYTGSNAGTAPEARLVFMALNTDGSGGIQCIDVNGDFLAKGYQEGARISTNSWGASTNGGYSMLSSLVDDYIWRNKDYLVLYAAGNSGPGAQTVGAPGTAKNVLTVGASENNRPTIDDMSDDPNSMAGFSSRGPTADGRTKPDVVAPGTWILSVRAAQAPDSSFWGSFNADYAYMGGTSMATPLAAGGAAIVREWVNKARGIAAPSAALLKAILVNGATQLPGAGIASNNSGFGRVDLKNTLNANYVIMDDRVQGLQTGVVISYTVQVVASGAQGTLLHVDGSAAPAAQAAGALQMTASSPVVAASAAITTPGQLRGEALPGFAQARPLTPIPDAGAGKDGLAPLPNAAPHIGGSQAPAAPATSSSFQPGTTGPSTLNYEQDMVGGGDFEDPDWTDIWSEVWLGSGIPVRTSDPAKVVTGNYSMWLGGTPIDDALFYPVQFPDTIDSALPSRIAFNVGIANQDPGFDEFCVALIDASGDFLGPYAPDNPECIGVNGSWSYQLTFDAADRAALAGQSAYLVVFTWGDGVAPHMSAYVDDIVLIVDFPSPTASVVPAAGPPGTTFLLTGKYNVPYSWVDICESPCTFDSYITTVYADAAGDIAAYLYSPTNIAPGLYPIQTYNIADRTAETSITISGAGSPTLSVTPTSGPAGTTFSFSGSDFLPGDQAIVVTVNGESAGSVGSNAAGAIAFTLSTAANTAPGAYTVRATDRAGRTDDVLFTVTAVAAGDPTLTVAPASGPPGTTFTFVGRNFTAGQPATVSLDGQALGQVNIDAAGSVTLTLETTSQTAPAQYTLAVTQGTRSAGAKYEVTAGGGAPLSGQGLYVTLAWTDPPAQAAAGQTLINNLDLFVDGPGGRVFANGGSAADTRNNVEVVRLETPAPGTYVISVVAARVNPTFGTQPYALVATSKQDFSAGQNSVDLGQTDAGTLRGVVFADLNRNGVRDAGEPGIAGQAVVVRQASGALTRQLTTDATGAYVASNLPAGSYNITLVLRAGYRLTTTAATTLTVAKGENSAPAAGVVAALHLPFMRR